MRVNRSDALMPTSRVDVGPVVDPVVIGLGDTTIDPAVNCRVKGIDKAVAAECADALRAGAEADG